MHDTTRCSTGDPDSEQLLMLVIGPGGTGKSVLIDAITETFAFHNQQAELAKCATSGIVATDIGGTTVHFWGGLGITRLKNVNSNSKHIIARRKKNILGKTCLIIDEMSMIHDTLLTDLAKVVAHTKKTANEGNEHLPFAGMHVILMGDFHQFPPVGKAWSALYSRRETTDQDALHGRAIYKQFKTVVALDQQVRVKDPLWTNILKRARTGDCTDADLETIRGLNLSHPNCPPTNFATAPWCDAILITTRNTVREAWNSARLKQHCRKTGFRRYVVSSEDYVKGSGAPLPDQVRLKVAGLKEKATGKLPDRIEMAVGMKAMITFNISTEGDLANGTRGTIEDIILDPREDVLEPDDDGTIKLKYPPALILFKPEGGSQISASFVDDRPHFPLQVPDGQVPIAPTTSIPFSVAMNDASKITVIRRQYALTAAYALTDIKSQGQTLGTIFVDLRQPPSGKISPFSVYVALSRSRGRDSIRLIGNFDETLFKTHPNYDLALEMERLHGLAAVTQ
jgi:ATP-dependent exoDNAse (exonuclease V) alpha subunit